MYSTTIGIQCASPDERAETGSLPDEGLRDDRLRGDLHSRMTAAGLTAARVTAAGLTSSGMAAARVTAARVTASRLTAARMTAAGLAASRMTAARVTAAGLTASRMTAAGVTASGVTAARVTAAGVTAADCRRRLRRRLLHPFLCDRCILVSLCAIGEASRQRRRRTEREKRRDCPKNLHGPPVLRDPSHAARRADDAGRCRYFCGHHHARPGPGRKITGGRSVAVELRG